jgi:hypothetical protein
MPPLERATGTTCEARWDGGAWPCPLRRIRRAASHVDDINSRMADPTTLVVDPQCGGRFRGLHTSLRSPEGQIWW